VELDRDPLPGEMGNEWSMAADRREGHRLDLESEGRREADGSHHPEGVLLEPSIRFADGPDPSGRDVFPATMRIDEPGRGRRVGRAPGERVHREVATGEVGPDRRPELDPVRASEVGVVVVRPERRDLVLVPRAPDRDRPEAVLVGGVLEQRGRLLGKGGRGKVPIDRRASEERIAQRPTDDVRRVPPAPERSKEVVDRVRDRTDQVVAIAQFRPRKRYVRQASLRSSARYGMNIE
jgi:hypothetical protein